MKMKPAPSFIVFHFAALLFCMADEPASIQATSSTPNHPVLLRNEHGPLTQIIVDVAEATDVVVTAFEFQLAGTDDLSDVESLTLFWTGEKDVFSFENQFGEQSEATSTIAYFNRQ